MPPRFAPTILIWPPTPDGWAEVTCELDGRIVASTVWNPCEDGKPLMDCLLAAARKKLFALPIPLEERGGVPVEKARQFVQDEIWKRV